MDNLGFRRSGAEVERAHELLVRALSGQFGIRPRRPERQELVGYASVLCWLLGHRHNRVFELVLEDLERKIARSEAAAPEEAVERSGV